MLVLSRKLSESVVAAVNGVSIKVVVVEIRGDKVRLGFEAPPEVVIHRSEVWASIASELASEPSEPNVQDSK